MTLPEAFVFPDNLAALATCRELGRAGVAVTVIGSKEGPASHSRFATFVRSPDFYTEPDRWSEVVIDVAAGRNQRPVLFPAEDAALLVADSHFEALTAHFRFPYPAPGVTRLVLDKLRLYAAAERVGIPLPAYTEITEVARLDTVDLDQHAWLAKPPCRYRLDGSGGVRTFTSVTGGPKMAAGDLGIATASVLDAGFRCILQEKIPGPSEELVSVALCIDQKGVVIGSYTVRKRFEYPEPFGDGLIIEVIADPGVVEMTAALLREIGYWGICDVEFKHDPRDGRFKLLDANPRVWLWHGLGTCKGGTPLVLAAYALAAGQLTREAGSHRISDGPRSSSITWVSPRRAAAFLASSYKPTRHGYGLPFRLALNALRTMLRDLRTFRDPLYLQPSAWRDLAGAVLHPPRGALCAGTARTKGREGSN